MVMEFLYFCDSMEKFYQRVVVESVDVGLWGGLGSGNAELKKINFIKIMYR